ncbi:MAG: hypothetical protein IMZ61_15465 [Planctomycetes bacterium]|nr:hypothetical protein [Planctomycetota bacterium]
MATLTLTEQMTSSSQIQTRILTLKSLLDQRKPFWDRMPIEKKRQWVVSNKDPIMSLAWDVYKYLNNNFFEREETHG